MTARMRITIALAGGLLALAGCADSEGRVTSESIREFWARVDADCRANLVRLGLASPSPAMPPSLWGAAGRPTVKGPPYGTLHASRRDDLVVVEVDLSNVPQEVRTVAAGLKLRNGAVPSPETIGFAARPDRQSTAGPGLDFDFGSGLGGPAGAKPELTLRVTYRLDATVSVDRGTFTLVLGKPGCDSECNLGITSAVSIDDGGPIMTGCARIGDDETIDGPPLPPLPVSGAPTISFRFHEQPGSARDRSVVWIKPVVSAVFPEGPPHRPVTAQAELPDAAR